MVPFLHDKRPMIKIYLGNVGSGKTVCCVREMYLNKGRKTTYSNIQTKIKGMVEIRSDMIVRKEVIAKKKKRDGSEEPVYKLSLNTDYWKDQVKQHDKGINVVLDEAHSVLNARRSMSKGNQILSDWLSLIRRVLGSDPSNTGDLILISQLPRRLDVIARDMCTHVRYHVGYFDLVCKKCGRSYKQHTQVSEPVTECACGSWDLKKTQYRILVYHFSCMDRFDLWSEYGMKTYHKRYFITGIEKYFHLYDTLQWDNLLSDIYD